MGNPVYICKHGLNSPTKVIFIDGFPFSFAIFFLLLRVVSISLAENTSAFKAPFIKKIILIHLKTLKNLPFLVYFITVLWYQVKSALSMEIQILVVK